MGAGTEPTKVFVVNESGYPLPSYATVSSAGLDMRAAISEPISLAPKQRSLVPTGLYIHLPQGTEAQIRPRSGLAFKHGITVLNAPGTIDADYRGELKVLLVNLSEETFTIEPGSRIAQLVVAEYLRVQLTPVTQLEETARGEGGFGHTGTN